jgi:hypothetical protein
MKTARFLSLFEPNRAPVRTYNVTKVRRFTTAIAYLSKIIEGIEASIDRDDRKMYMSG